MGLFDKLFRKGQTNTAKAYTQGNDAALESSNAKIAELEKTQPSSKDVIDMMAKMADAAMNEGEYERAVENYRNILKLEPNETAQYNLGSLYAQGKGVEQDFMEGAYWFRQAEISGDKQARNLCRKCLLDFAHQNFDQKSPEQLYSDMMRFVKRVYPETTDVNLEVCRKLYAIAGNHFNKKEYSVAAKLFRATAEYGNDGYSQNYLAVLYNAGAGIEKNDLASLYWFDKAVDNGAADVAKKDRDGMLNAYKINFSPKEFYEEMLKLSGWCSIGSEDVPRDAAKAVYWREMGERVAQNAAGEKGGFAITSVIKKYLYIARTSGRNQK